MKKDVEWDAERQLDHCAYLQGRQVWQDSQDTSDEDRARRHLRCGRFQRQHRYPPLWYYNIVASPPAELQCVAVKQEMRAHEVFGKEKDEWWRRADAAYSEWGEVRARIAAH